MSVTPSRLQDLLKIQCRIFSHTYNPTRARSGNSVLRQRLKGPAVAAYYPRRVTSIKQLLQTMKKGDPDSDLDVWDEDEEDRLEHLAFAKQRGKGAPKKKKSADESKKFKGKKKQPAVAAAVKGIVF